MSKPSPKHCVSHAEKKVRVHEVFELLLEGKASATVRKHCMEKWDMSFKGAGRYVEDADKLMTEVLKSKRESRVNRAIGQREKLIEKLIDGDQLAMAAQVMGDSAKLQGLYAQEDQAATINIKVSQK